MAQLFHNLCNNNNNNNNNYQDIEVTENTVHTPIVYAIERDTANLHLQLGSSSDFFENSVLWHAASLDQGVLFQPPRLDEEAAETVWLLPPAPNWLAAGNAAAVPVSVVPNGADLQWVLWAGCIIQSNCSGCCGQVAPFKLHVHNGLSKLKCTATD